MISPIDVVRFAVTVLRERRLRAILTIIGIAIGPAAMVAIIGTVQGYSDVIINQLSSLGENTIVVFPSGSYSIGSSDINYMKSLRGVSHVTPFYSIRGKYLRSDGKSIDVTIYAIDINELFNVISSLELREGEFPLPTAYSSGIIGYGIAFNDEDIQIVNVGNTISIRVAESVDGDIRVKIHNIRVSGILEKYGNALVMNPDATIYLPLEAGRTMLGMSRYSGVLITVRGSEYISEVTEAISDKYKELVEVIAFERIAESVGSVINTLDFLLFSLSISAFIVAITGIMATMFTSVVERTREIGVLKALGFSSINILILILMESIIISIIGGVFGISIGTVGAYILSSRSFRLGRVVIYASPAITPELIGLSLGMSIFVGIVGGLIPAYKASKVMPIVALRYE
jgi:putative ABC transport system permease protein